ncbi:MAG: translation initiation factor IF-2, partial [Bdellovibrionales bacterium]|nr:translation initiation factor IF-2 [Bdellovibrionales bacterium]
IGAYSVQIEEGKFITFIDTPGHAAFTAMRARGADITDVVIIVVAADDGMMPQTEEAISHVKAADIPITVAINKMDKPGANPDRIKQQLMEYQLVSEEWGGDTIFCQVSAIKGEGIPELLEQVNLVAEVADLKANPKRSATGIVIESRVEKGRGSVATLLVEDGTLGVGQPLVAGSVSGRVRSMMNDRGQTVKEVGPGFPVEVMGLEFPPDAGDRFDVCKDEESARKIADHRKSEKEKAEVPSSKMSLDQIFAKVKAGDVKELPVVLKADVAGSLEAVKGMFEKTGTDEVKVKVVHSAVGGISENDVLLAGTAGGMILGFNVRPDVSAQRMAKEKGIEIRTYSIIYELIDDVKKALSGLLAPDIVEKIMGRAQVRETFSVPKVGLIAGCHVVDGKIGRNNQIRLLRDGVVVYEGTIGSLKRFKDDAKEVQSGYDCGIGIENYNDVKVGDELETFIKESISRELT